MIFFHRRGMYTHFLFFDIQIPSIFWLIDSLVSGIFFMVSPRWKGIFSHISYHIVSSRQLRIYIKATQIEKKIILLINNHIIYWWDAYFFWALFTFSGWKLPPSFPVPIWFLHGLPSYSNHWKPNIAKIWHHQKAWFNVEKIKYLEIEVCMVSSRHWLLLLPLKSQIPPWYSCECPVVTLGSLREHIDGLLWAGVLSHLPSQHWDAFSQ